jgi:hypothetical protein
MAEGNKRPVSARVRWIWTGVLALPVVAAIVVTAILSQQPLGRPPVTPPQEAVTDDGYTDFSAAGVEYATSKRLVTVNASSLPIAASTIGLPDDGAVTIPSNSLGNKVRIVVGDDRVEATPVGAITVAATGGTVTTLTYINADIGIADVRNQLLKDVLQYGTDADEVEFVVGEVKTKQRNGEAYQGTLQPGTLLGVTETTSLHCDATSLCTLTHVIDLDD